MLRDFTETDLDKLYSIPEYKITDEDAQGLLQFAKSDHEDKVINAALDLLQDKIATATDKDGNTFLHLAVAHDRTKIVDLVIKKFQEQAPSLCKKVNNKGETPLLLAIKQQHSVPIANILLPATLDCSMKPLQRLLNLDLLLQDNFEAEDNPILISNLTMGCEAINSARIIISDSSSHPQYNNTTNEDKANSVRKLNVFRKFIPNETISFHKRKEQIINSGIGNCAEFSELVVASILDSSRNRVVRIEFIIFTNDDHMFVVMDRAANSDINNLSTWGPNAVIIDAWSGLVYPASKYKDKLMGLYYTECEKNLEFSFNFLRAYNPNYHKMESICDLMITPRVCSKDYSFKIKEPSPTHVAAASTDLATASVIAKPATVKVHTAKIVTISVAAKEEKKMASQESIELPLSNEKPQFSSLVNWYNMKFHHISCCGLFRSSYPSHDIFACTVRIMQAINKTEFDNYRREIPAKIFLEYKDFNSVLEKVAAEFLKLEQSVGVESMARGLAS